ncbi:MAG TPA: lipopolysaccharide assembly protein LapA domain-containing protein [Acidimicrobiia bacterium]|jgi:uncharacterized integral membrane protein
MSDSTSHGTTALRPAATDNGGGGVGHSARLVIGTLLLAALVVFGLDNRKTVKVSWIVSSGKAPLALVLAAAAVAGALIGWLYLHRPHRSHH